MSVKQIGQHRPETGKKCDWYIFIVHRHAKYNSGEIQASISEIEPEKPKGNAIFNPTELFMETAMLPILDYCAAERLFLSLFRAVAVVIPEIGFGNV